MNPECQRAIEIQERILKWQNRYVMIYRCGCIYWAGQIIIQSINCWALDSKLLGALALFYFVILVMYIWLLRRCYRKRRITYAIRANLRAWNN